MFDLFPCGVDLLLVWPQHQWKRFDETIMERTKEMLNVKWMDTRLLLLKDGLMQWMVQRIAFPARRTHPILCLCLACLVFAGVLFGEDGERERASDTWQAFLESTHHIMDI
jgi:hypothetical protein